MEQEIIDNTIAAIGTILEKHPKMEDAKGEIECPLCKGILHYTKSGYNNHIWGKCETEDCLSWVQ
jgi:hypothetical protein